MKFVFTCLACLVFLLARGQDQPAESDSLIVEGGPDTVLIKSYAKRYNPRKALLYAAVLPGLGQIYNKKYWKLPLVYGGLFAINKYGVMWYNDLHKQYRGWLFENIENGLGDTGIHPASGLTTATLRRAVDRYRRDRDFLVILSGLVYVLQIVDAHVDAHLKEFDINPQLRVSVEPTFNNNVVLGKQTGASVIFRF